MKSNFMTWLLLVLPIFLFVIIISWVFGKLLAWVWKFVHLLPPTFVEFLWQSETFVHILCLLILLWIIWLLWFIVNWWRIWQRIGKGLNSLISRVPLLNSLSKITNQIANTLENTDSFKKVVLLKFPTEKTWSIGFITWEDISIFDKELGKNDLVSIFVPTTPNPTNWFLLLLNTKDFIETDTPVATALSFIISMGTAWATEELLKNAKLEKK